jgi:hypothetical protein
MRAELGPLADHDRIDMGDAQAALFEQPSRVFEESLARCTFPSGVGVREMRADVAQAGSSKQRISKRVAQDVAIGMSDRALLVRQFDPADQ